MCFHEAEESRGPRKAEQIGLLRKHIFDTVDRSVERLGTYIDVLQIHRLDRETPMDEIMKVWNDVVESGIVRYIVANSVGPLFLRKYAGWHSWRVIQMAACEFQMLHNIAGKHGWHRFISMQCFWNRICREEERELGPHCDATEIGYIPWSPLAAGILAHSWTDCTDKREQDDVFLTLLFRSQEDQAAKSIAGRVREVAKQRRMSMAQVAVAWVFSKSSTAPIMCLDSLERIDQAVEATETSPTKKEIEYLEEPYASEIAMTFWYYIP
jgi:aryl-alcohol dehydrogenase-like predicted oxidoreductase